MKVKWNEFAKRRNLSIDDFKSMSYEEYCRWCSYRNVIPVKIETFLVKDVAVAKSIETIIPDPVLSPGREEKKIDLKSLRKLRKPDIMQLCADFSIEIDSSMTKKTMVNLLIEMHNQ